MCGKSVLCPPLRSCQVSCAESIDERSEELTFAHRMAARAMADEKTFPYTCGKHWRVQTACSALMRVFVACDATAYRRDGRMHTCTNSADKLLYLRFTR